MGKPDTIPSNATGARKIYGAKSRAPQTMERPDEFVGWIPELDGIIFDVVSLKKAERFDMSKRDIAQYLGKELKRGGDIRHTILEMTVINIPKPKRPKKPTGLGTSGSLTEEQQDEYDFDCDLYKQDVRAFVIRRDLLEENMQNLIRYSSCNAISQ